jgi:hypothetical protein
MGTITLFIMIIGLIMVLAVDTHQKRRAFIDGHRKDRS